MGGGKDVCLSSVLRSRVRSGLGLRKKGGVWLLYAIDERKQS